MPFGGSDLEEWACVEHAECVMRTPGQEGRIRALLLDPLECKSVFNHVCVSARAQGLGDVLVCVCVCLCVCVCIYI